MDRPLGNLDPRDPKLCLSYVARVRIDDADAEGNAIRIRAEGRILARNRFAPEPNADLDEYSSEDARDALERHEARLEHARLVIVAIAKEFWAFGKSRQEISTIMRGEIEGALYSLQLSIMERDLLELEVFISLNRLDAEASVAVKTALVAPGRDSSGSLKKSRKPPERNSEVETIRKLIRDMGPAKLSATEMCARLSKQPLPPGVRWKGKTWAECLRNNRGAVETWISKAKRPS